MAKKLLVTRTNIDAPRSSVLMAKRCCFFNSGPRNWTIFVTKTVRLIAGPFPESDPAALYDMPSTACSFKASYDVRGHRVLDL